MDGYSAKFEGQMGRFYRSLSKRERRQYPAMEAVRLEHGGIEYVSRLLGCGPKIIRRGIAELEAQVELETPRQRKKGAVENP